jgi:hypothetical protein
LRKECHRRESQLRLREYPAVHLNESVHPEVIDVSGLNYPGRFIECGRTRRMECVDTESESKNEDLDLGFFRVQSEIRFSHRDGESFVRQ